MDTIECISPRYCKAREDKIVIIIITFWEIRVQQWDSGIVGTFIGLNYHARSTTLTYRRFPKVVNLRHKIYKDNCLDGVFDVNIYIKVPLQHSPNWIFMFFIYHDCTKFVQTLLQYFIKMIKTDFTIWLHRLSQETNPRKRFIC